MLYFIAAIILPTLAGFAIPFFKSDRAPHLLWALAITPSYVLILVALAASSGAIRLSDIFILVLALCFPVLFAILGRVFGKPFAEIWRERKDRQIQETFR